ncbi:hypothetical protein Pyn_33499 [Prunus yedoensis var. nudiflora]|uniref:Uncharacterized protein n=1 Tax=Prunus yedoensis var. nudiflora TaxID=2094558 RepID=A0A314UGF0_PRUYE|nr:hypothetical protein Pyn_33499 [Prunus yedoensis var. nudiflora]
MMRICSVCSDHRSRENVGRSRVPMAELTGHTHTSRVLFMTQAVYVFRPQMDALWPLQPRMRRFELGMCLG